MAEATVRKFISIKPIAANDEMGQQTRSLNIAYNRLGGTLTGIGSSLQNFSGLVKFQGEFLKDLHGRNIEQIENETSSRIEAQQDLLGRQRRERGRQQDAEAEKKQESEVEKDNQARKTKIKAPKKETSWIERLAKFLSPMFEFLRALIAPFITYKVLDWMSDPANQEKLKTFLSFLGGIWKFSRYFSRLGIGLILDGITRVFGDNPDKEGLAKHFDKLFGALQIVGGIASVWIASRVLMPWKLIGDVKFMQSLATALNVSEQNMAKGGKGDKGKGGKPRTDSKGRTAAQRLKDMKRAKRIKALRESIVKVRKGLKGGGLFGALWRGTKSASKFLFDKTVQGSKAVMDWAGKNFTKLSDMARSTASGAWNWGKEQAKRIGDLAELAKNPKKLGAVVLEKLKSSIEPVIKKDARIKQVLDVAQDPKKGKAALKALVSKTMKSPGLKSFRNFLVAAKNNAKIGGIDKVIASVLALIDYGVFGESPVNAVLKAIGGLLGYSAGFAIGAPFGGVPGFVAGAAGGFAGEFIAEKILEGLAKIPALRSVKDPLAPMLPGPFKDRPLIRDPSKPMPWEADLLKAAEGAEEKAAGGPVKPNKDTAKEKTSTRAKNVTAMGGGEEAVIAAGKYILSQGFSVGEHPNFRKNSYQGSGANTGVGYNPQGGERVGGHSAGSAHYKGLAIDVTDWRSGDWLGRTRALAQQMYEKRQALKLTQIIHDGWGSWFSGEANPTRKPYGGHDSHLHLAFAKGKGGAEDLGGELKLSAADKRSISDATADIRGGQEPVAEPEPPSADAAKGAIMAALNKFLGDTVESGGSRQPAPTPQPVTQPKTDNLNKVAENLSKLSSDKARRDKEGKVKTNTQLMVMQQQIITPSGAQQAQQVSYGSTSPLVLSK